MNQPFAIVVLSYNHPEITTKCLSSIKDHPVFVIHNGSEEKNQLLIQQKFPQHHHLILKKNSGYTGGANFGLREAFKNFNHVLFLTNDTELLQLPSVAPDGFCAVTIYKRNTQAIDSTYAAVDIKRGLLTHLKDLQAPQKNFYIPGTAFWMDKKSFEHLGGFDESFHTYWDDVDLSFRASKLNITLGYSSETLVKHKIGKTCHRHAFYTYYLFQRNRKKFMLKHSLQSLSFWLRFHYDIIKYCKYRFHYWWKIIYE